MSHPAPSTVAIEGDFYQVGVVVRDIDEGMARYSQLFGLGPFWRLDTHYRARYREWEGIVANRNAFARWGDLWLEMVAPGEGQSNAREWLEQRGEGIFHLGYAVDDVMAHPARWPVCFQPLETRTKDGHPALVHLDTVKEFGYFAELTERSLAQRINEGIAAALADPTAPGHVACP
ncbi:VOC family protein [Novosphingobium malaysiense]|uniref:VOC family protein n=1 Tax=Novosphingobium malaysiense TaxID=1348853 RepID=UPI00068ACDF3|nr:VOC family protein [Novosphingobium malaysiense]